MKNAPGRPRLWDIGTAWIEDRKVYLSLTLHSCKDFRWTIGIKAFCCVEDSTDHLIGFVCHSIAFEAIGDDTIILRPDGATLVGKRIIGRILARECPYSPAAPHVLL